MRILPVLLASLFFLVPFLVCGQAINPHVINSSGGNASISDKIYEWSLGELALVESMSTPQLTLNNGFLQALPPLFIITPRLYVAAPNLLSPDGDGINDVWVIQDLDRYEENELTIVDRGGRVVHKAKDYRNDWSGDLKGLPLTEDTYYYILILKKKGQTATQRGFVTIIR